MPGELDAFFDRLGRVLTYATRELGAVPMTFAEYHQHFTARGRPGRRASA